MRQKQLENSVKTCEEGQEIFDLKPLTEEEKAWLEEHFMDFCREQYLVRQNDMREALKKLHDVRIEEESWERLK